MVQPLIARDHCTCGLDSRYRATPRGLRLKGGSRALSLWVGALLLVPFYLWETLTVATLDPRPTNLMVIGYVIVFPSIVSYLCFNRGVELVGANRAGLFIHLMPVFGSLMAVLLASGLVNFLNE